MMRRFVSLACGVWILAAGQAIAQVPQGVVVELYTSQGCSSCPPADALLSELAKQPGVIPLALHVDYWDYIGWQDVFADPAYTARQKAYAKAAHDKMVYTQQMIIGGAERVVGNKPKDVVAAIARKAAMTHPVQIFVERQGAVALIRIEANAPLEAGAFVQLVRFNPAAHVDITRGENAGLQAQYSNIVTSWERVADWAGDAPLQFDAKLAGDEPAVVIVQRHGPAEILAAARID